MSGLYMISVYLAAIRLTAVCMTTVYMTALYVSRMSAYIKQYVLDFNSQDRNKDACNIHDCSVCSFNEQEFSVFNSMSMTAVFINAVYLAALNEKELWELHYSRQQ